MSHLQHPELEVWFGLYSLIGPETSIAQALPLLDRAGATPQDWDVLLAMRAWMAEAREERRERERQQGR